MARRKVHKVAQPPWQTTTSNLLGREFQNSPSMNTRMPRSKSTHMNKRRLQNSSFRIWSSMLGGNAMCLATPKVLQFWTPTFDAGLSNEVSKVFGTQKPTTIRPKWNKSPNYFTYKDYNLAFLERGGPIRVIILTKNAINVHV